MFLGDFQHTLDAKGRVSLPSKFRNAMTGEIVLSKGFEGCLYVHPAEKYTDFLAKVMGGNDFDPKNRQVRRFFTSGAVDTELDSAGRVQVPQVLREYAGLSRDVAVIGNGDRIEIWNADAWAAYNGDAAGKVERLAEELADKGVL